MLRKWSWLLVLACCCFTQLGCSRLTFIRPSVKRGDSRQIAPTYDVSGKNADGGSLSVDMRLNVAANLYREGQLAEAERRVREILRDSPQSSNANTLLALILSGSGRLAEAGKYYLAATNATPNNGLYANNYGTWLCSNGQPEKSLAWFDRAMADPTYRTPKGALLNAANCASQAGQLARAESSWRTVLAHDPKDLQALAGMARLSFGNGNYLDARAFAERWLAIAPEDSAGLRFAAEVEQKLGDNAAATRYLSRLQAISHRSEQKVPRTQ